MWSGDEDEDVVYLSVLVALYTLCLQCSSFYAMVCHTILCCTELHYAVLRCAILFDTDTDHYTEQINDRISYRSETE